MSDQLLRLSAAHLFKKASRAAENIRSLDNNDFLSDLQLFLDENRDMDNKSEVSLKELRKMLINHRALIEETEPLMREVREWLDAMQE